MSFKIFNFEQIKINNIHLYSIGNNVFYRVNLSYVQNKYFVGMKRSYIYFFENVNVYRYSFLIRTDNYFKPNGYLLINSTQ